jgi:hypothetical protein
MVLGLALVLLVCSTVLALGGVVVILQTSWNPALAILIVVGLLTIGFFGGLAIAHTRVLPKMSKAGALLTAAIVWPAATYTPIALVKFRMADLAYRAIPAQTDIRRIATTSDWIGDTTVGRKVTVRFATKRERDQLVKFYRAELGRNGWYESTFFSDTYGYFTRKSEVMIILIGGAGADGLREVKVDYVPSF